MLSYRHAFHAGNHADVLKHLVISRIVLYSTLKEKPFSYIDSHAGAGMYDLSSEWARKTGESDTGILSLLGRTDIPDEAKPYISLCQAMIQDQNRYPGSPEIVRYFSRAQDQLTLLELHTTEIDHLRSTFQGDSRIHIHHRDGFSGLPALCPPTPRRGFALIDPSYETVDDYTRAAQALLETHQRWPAGILALWYPVIERRETEIATLKRTIGSSGIPEILQIEMTIGREQSQTGDQNSVFGLTGSGMIVIQPPWTLKNELEKILAWLVPNLAFRGQGAFTLE